MFDIDTRSTKPIYEQIIDNIKELSLRGILKTEDKLPSVRQLANMLTVNPNTVSKAYQELERQKIIETIRGRGTFMCKLGEIEISKERMEKAVEKLKDVCIELSVMGISKNEIMEKIEMIYENIEEKEEVR